jgi:DNA-binding GntR family transcriptional regulator
MMPEGANPQADPRKYVRLAAVLRGRILDGTLRPGESVPSISTLVTEHGGWARKTCAKALRMLEAEGLLLRVHGLGYFINGPVGTVTGRAEQPPILRVADLLHSHHDDEV